MHARLALLFTILASSSATAEPRPARAPRPACTPGSWHVEWSAKNGGGDVEVTIDPAHPRLTVGPDRQYGVTVVAFDPASCRVDVLVLTEIRRGAEGYEDEDNTLRLSFTAGPGARTVTGDYERHVFDPKSDTTGRVKGVAKRTMPVPAP